MSNLNGLVKLLMAYVKDARPVAQADIEKFAAERSIDFREDHVQFFTRFGCEPGGRPEIFRQYGGDFDFANVKRVYLENHPQMETPPGAVYFGSSFIGDSYCIDCKSGKIYLYDEGDRYGVVHESIDGFLLKCLVSVYVEEAFDEELSQQDMGEEFIAEFRLKNKDSKINEATWFGRDYKNIENPPVFAEYYFIDHKLVALYPTTTSLLTLSGGVLSNVQW
ncbi:hypothetical protein F2P45_33930 [Massilia sp. CCM 8733]|uniref:Knr4/Smi1-like domain-containing protein n=1 Tax=Massilia mucilaginosa TaxID=2609282 RepID=A0ABX0P697_9BURK|nr:SMI1/KNR4 family protein [Massilia mucilaginosa]NHZ93957.1 hypothetical protein [Massilia mucilaginosa]